MYLKRAGVDQPTAPNPWLAVALTIGVPVAIVIIGLCLLRAINLKDGAAVDAASRHALVRTAVSQALDRDLAADRLQEVLSRTADLPTHTKDEKNKTARSAERTTSLKFIAARLNADRARLSDAVTALAMTPHPLKDKKPLQASATVGEVLRARLTDDAVRQRVSDWVTNALDPHSKRLGALTVNDFERIVPQAVADSVAVESLRTSVETAVTPRFDSYDAKAGESGWTSDVGARLVWGVVALVFCLTFVMVVFTAGEQILKIGDAARVVFLVVVGFASVAALVFASQVFAWFEAPTPLTKALDDYAQLFTPGVSTWVSAFNGLRAVGVVMLVGGSIATFWVKVEDDVELEQQLRGFKALFNSGAVFLLSSVLEVYARLRWPATFAADDATRAALQGAAATFAAVIGAAFAVVLFSAYLVTTIVLRQQARAHGVPAQKTDELFSKFGFGDLASQQGMRLAQALLPLLPGFINVLTTIA